MAPVLASCAAHRMALGALTPNRVASMRAHNPICGHEKRCLRFNFLCAGSAGIERARRAYSAVRLCRRSNGKRCSGRVDCDSDRLVMVTNAAMMMRVSTTEVSCSYYEKAD